MGLKVAMCLINCPSFGWKHCLSQGVELGSLKCSIFNGFINSQSAFMAEEQFQNEQRTFHLREKQWQKQKPETYLKIENVRVVYWWFWGSSKKFLLDKETEGSISIISSLPKDHVSSNILMPNLYFPCTLGHLSGGYCFHPYLSVHLCVFWDNNSITTLWIITRFHGDVNMVTVLSWLNFGSCSLEADWMTARDVASSGSPLNATLNFE